MAFRSRCPYCHREFSYPDKADGRKVLCGKCQMTYIAQKPAVELSKEPAAATAESGSLFGRLLSRFKGSEG